ncbi:MAG: MBL fold metallo-hydrolase [Clostridia bacterium]|nr:MBL fold metallo-hydrolase [Clostridia bacterium]
MFLERVLVGRLVTNCYVICDENTGIGAVIDPGVFGAEVKNAIERSGMKELKYILCTHGHFDHICGVAKLKKAYPEAKVCIGKEDTSYLTDGRLSMATVFKMDFEPCATDIEFSHDDTFSMGDIDIRVFSAPGHTPGGVLYILESERIIFTGDTLFRGSIGNTGFEGGNLMELIGTLREIKRFPDDFVIYAGHGESSTIGYEKRTNIYLK